MMPEDYASRVRAYLRDHPKGITTGQVGNYVLRKPTVMPEDIRAYLEGLVTAGLATSHVVKPAENGRGTRVVMQVYVATAALTTGAGPGLRSLPAGEGGRA